MKEGTCGYTSTHLIPTLVTLQTINSIAITEVGFRFLNIPLVRIL